MAQKRGPGRPKGSKNKNTASRKTAPVSGVKNKAADSGKNKVTNVKTEERVKKEVTAIVLIAVGGFLAISMHTSLCGIVGDWISDIFTGLFGYGGLAIPYLLIVYAILIFANLTPALGARTVLLLTGFYLSVDMILVGHMVPNMEYGILGIKEVFRESAALESGGVFGMYIGSMIYKVIGVYGLYILFAVIAIVCLMLLINTPISRFFEIGREKKEARKERKAEKELLAQQEAIKKQELEEEMALKREAVEKAGKKGREHRSISERAADFTGDGDGIEDIAERNTETTTDESWKDRTIDQKNKSNILNVMNNSSILNDDLGQVKDDREPDMTDLEELLNDTSIKGNVPDEKDRQTDDDEGGISFTGEPIGAHTPAAKREAAKAAALKGVAVRHGISENDDASDKEQTKTVKKNTRYKMPPLDLLTASKVAGSAPTLNKREKALQLENTLKSFNVAAEVKNVTQGPSVTRYEVQPEKGVKVSSIVKLENDIALNMEAKSIRIEAPIPGKPVVGIEIENANRQMVSLREIIGSQNFRTSKSKLSFAVGRDIEGTAVVGDLYKMPHLLIAGATGSGKSVCINAILMSILYKAKPHEVKLILIDPKMVELGQYNGIPHLLIPVVTDPSKAASALNWAVREMLDRYKKFAAEGVKDMNGYNRAMEVKGRKEEVLPQVVIVIDELADLMMAASAQVEDAICRLAQMARAAGMHLIVATQRPSVDVITGLIKANIPSRIAFLVSSQVDSRTILDMVGAEKLAGNGDMLFNPQGTAKQPRRVQGAFVSEEDVRKVLDFIKEQGEEGSYDSGVLEQIEKGSGYEVDNEGDELLADAVETVVRAGQASTSMLQRRFRIGYNRAARIIDIMEERGIIGPSEGSRPRQVKMTEAEMEKFLEQERNGEQLKM